jgi:hemin uptake protein HemP
VDIPPKFPVPKPIAGSNAHRPRFDSKDLLCGASAVEIDHAGQRYLLRVTRENKLILTK